MEGEAEEGHLGTDGVTMAASRGCSRQPDVSIN